jgi:hypothetical protein
VNSAELGAAKERLLAEIERDQRVLVRTLADLAPLQDDVSRLQFCNGARQLQRLITAKRNLSELRNVTASSESLYRNIALHVGYEFE